MTDGFGGHAGEHHVKRRAVEVGDVHRHLNDPAIREGKSERLDAGQPTRPFANRARDGLSDLQPVRRQIDIEGHERLSGADDGGPRGRVGHGRAKVWLPRGVLEFLGEALESAASNVFETASFGTSRGGFVEKDRQVTRHAECSRHVTSHVDTVGQRDAADGHKGDHVGGADARMDASMVAEVDTSDGDSHQVDGRSSDRRRGPGEREHAAVVRDVPVNVEERRSSRRHGGPAGVHDHRIASLADVGDALDNSHATNLPWHAGGRMGLYSARALGIIPRATMSDTHRLESEPGRGASDRETRAEALLVEGLDRYFIGDFEGAVHVWTRVLFLDRTHARARAYIERARTALGERQRRADEMLHAAEELLATGQLDRARSLLQQAARTSTDDGRIARIWSELERGERAQGAGSSIRTMAASDVAQGPVWRPGHGAVSTFVMAGALGALAMALLTSPAVREWTRGRSAVGPAPGVVRLAAPEVLSQSEAALVRARTYANRGQLAEALAALERATAPEVRSAAHALEIEIQAALLLVATVGDGALDSTRATGAP
jgi:tetratricopeptide (TPR) repeat protein